MDRRIGLIIVAGLLFLSFACTLKTETGTHDIVETTGEGSDVTGQEIQAVGALTTSDDKTSDNRENDSKESRIPVTLYYQDGDGYILPVTRRIPKQLGVAKAAVSMLIDSALNREEIEYFGLYPVLPKGTKVLGINLVDGIAAIDFNDSFLEYENEKGEKNAISAVVYTLTEFNTIDGVKILINGREEQELKYGTNILGVLDRTNVLVNSKRVNLQEGFEKTDIYMFKTVKDKYTYILPTSIEHPVAAEEEKPAIIIDLLAEEPDDEKLYTEAPEGIRLIRGTVEDGVLTLDFGKEILNYGGRSREDGFLKQILYSIKQIKGIKKVRILIEGNILNIPEGTDISSGIILPEGINDIIDTAA